MKISIIGAGNVGGMTAARLAGWSAEAIILFDVVKGLAKAKAFDIQDSRSLTGSRHFVLGTDDLNYIAGSDILVITAGLARKPGMSREELLEKNSKILGDLCRNIRRLCPEAIVIVVTNPLDLMTNFVLKSTGFPAQRVLGMGISLDASRFANLVAEELSVDINTVSACVIGSHGRDMIPLPGLTTVGGVALNQLLPEDKLSKLVKSTIERGAEIVSLFGSGSAYFAPSAAVDDIIRSIVMDEKRVIGVSAYLSGEYGIKGVCLGIPARIGKHGIEQLIELELGAEEKKRLANSAISIEQQLNKIGVCDMT